MKYSAYREIALEFKIVWFMMKCVHVDSWVPKNSSWLSIKLMDCLYMKP
jgi:hypothetical protein